MLTKFNLYCEGYNVGDHNVGPPITGPGPGGFTIGSKGGCGGGRIGGEFDGNSDVTSTPAGGYKYKQSQPKPPRDKKRDRAIKRLKKLNMLSFEDWSAQNK